MYLWFAVLVQAVVEANGKQQLSNGSVLFVVLVELLWRQMESNSQVMDEFCLLFW